MGLHLDHARYRARFTLQAGTYANDNYQAEPGVLRNVFEAWAGLALNRGNTLWIDAGVLPSHLGFESAVSMDNWTLTRSLSTESSPYYLAGVRLEYYQDAAGAIIPVSDTNGFRTTGVSWNLDYAPAPAHVCRLEMRWMGSCYPVFRSEGGSDDNSVFIGGSLAIKMDQVLVASPAN